MSRAMSRRPASNRVSASVALKTNDMWSKTIGYDPYAAGNEPEITDSIAASQQAASLQLLAKMSNLSGVESRGGCKRCGMLGHLSFQCRNAPIGSKVENKDDDSDDSSSDDDNNNNNNDELLVKNNDKQNISNQNRVEKRSRSESSQSDDDNNNQNTSKNLRMNEKKKEEKHKKHKSKDHKHHKKHKKHKKKHSHDT
eukprot:gene4999-6984_t